MKLSHPLIHTEQISYCIKLLKLLTPQQTWRRTLALFYKRSAFYPAIPLPDKLKMLIIICIQADRAASGAGSGFSLFGGRQEKWENAADLYTQAANAFRMQKQSAQLIPKSCQDQS
jgi:hypothetical protein